MFRYDGTRWVSYRHKITYTQTLEVYDDILSYYPADAVVEDVTLTPEQTKRLEAVTNEIPISDLTAFVMDDADVPGMEDYRKETAVKDILSTLTDEQAISNAGAILSLADEWALGESYERYTYLKHEGVLYKTIHPIRGGVDNSSPPESPELYTRIGAISGGEIAIEEWRQPTGEHDAYKIGDKVLHKGQTWVCTLGDGAGLNSWEPGVYGWEVVA